MAANAAPAAPPNAAPTKAEPVRKAPAKPQAAPMIIMPSTPRLSTPERSATSSPAAASSSGVEAAITDRTMASTSSMRSLSRHADEADAMDDQGIAGEHVEQQHPLKDLGEIERHLQGDLRALAADEGQRKKQAGDQDAERIEPSEKRDDDGREAVARREARLQVPDRAGHLDDAGEACERARQREGEQHQLVGVEPRKSRRAGGGADHANLEALDGAAEQHGGKRDQDQRRNGAGMQAAAFDQGRDGRDWIEFRGGREVEAVRIAPGATHQIVHEQIGDIDQHQAGEDLARAEADLADRRNHGVERAAQRAEH